MQFVYNENKSSRWTFGGTILITNKTAKDLPELLKEHTTLVFNIYADWCGECEMLKPELEKLSENGHVVVRSVVDLEDNQRFVVENKIQGTPQIYIYHNGKTVWSFNGFVPYGEIERELCKWKTATMKWAIENINKINLIDVRTPAEFEVRSIDGAVNHPMGLLLMVPEKYLDKDKLYYLHCGSGGRAARAAEELTKIGYKVIACSDGIKSI